MTNKLPAVFLAIILAGWSLVAAQPQQVCIDCIDPNGTLIPTCTPVPSNPRKYVAGSNGLAETGAIGHYNWNPYIGSRLPVTDPDHEHIPMVRDWDDLTDQILSQLTITNSIAHIGGNSDWVMLFNEPDLAPPAGSSMTVDEVVLGQAIVEALFPDKLIVSPAYSPYNYTRLETDYENFYATYGRYPRWDAIAYHCYFFDTAAPCMSVLDWMVAFADRIEQDTGKRPGIWCTEFAALVTTGSAGPNWAPSVAAASAYIDAMELLGVERFFIFPHCDEAMPYYECALVIDNKLTPMGEMYRSK